MDTIGVRCSTSGRALAVLLCLLMATLPVLGQEPPAQAGGAQPGDIAGARQDGTAAGNRDGSRAGSVVLWTTLGFFFNVVGVGAAPLVVPAPGVSSLMGRSPHYVERYISSYRAARRTAQFRWSAIGCGAAVLLVTAAVLVAAQDLNFSCSCWDQFQEMFDCCQTGLGCLEISNNCGVGVGILVGPGPRAGVLGAHRLGLLSDPAQRRD